MNSKSNPFLDLDENEEDFNPKSNSSSNSSNNILQPQIDQQNQKKYNIIDFYWLINPKINNKEKLSQNEVGLITIGYNADFNNIRIGLFEITDNVLMDYCIHKYNAKQLSFVNVYSETAEKIVYRLTNNTADNIINYERIFSQGMIKQEWKPSKCMFIIQNDPIIKVIIQVNDKYFYQFTEWQLKALFNSLKYSINGQAWSTSLNK